MSFYTYAHIRNDTGLIFYIGKGSGRRAWKTDSRSKHWQNIASKHGYRVEILARWCDESDAFAHERLLIDVFKSLGHQLVNLTDGGEGASGLVRGAEFSAALSQRKRGNTNMLGKQHSHETRALMSQSQKGRVITDDHKAKISASKKGNQAALGYKHTELARQRMSASAKARWAKQKSAVI